MRISDWSSDVCSSDLLEFLRGLTALFENTLFVNTPKYVFAFDVTTWGWLHLIWGVVLAAVGGAILAGRLIGRIVGLSIVTIALVLNFVSLPVYPLWLIILIALSSEEHTSELQSLMRISSAVFCLKNKKHTIQLM